MDTGKQEPIAAVNGQRHRLVQVLLFAALLAGDQFSKYLASKSLPGSPVTVVPGVLQLTYIRNTGAAFDSFSGKTMPLFILSLLTMAVLCFLLLRLPMQRKWLPLQYGMVALLSGGIGNSIDRLVRGFVVDFIYFVPINFPKFNLADCYITLSILLIFYLVIFKYKEKELVDVFKRKAKTE